MSTAVYDGSFYGDIYPRSVLIAPGVMPRLYADEIAKCMGLVEYEEDCPL